MKKAVVSIVFLFILIGSVYFVSSVQVKKLPITLELEKRQNFTMDIIDPLTSEVLQTISGRSDGAGDYIYSYYHWIDKIKLRIEVQKDGGTIQKEFGPYNLGENNTAIINFFENGDEVGDANDSSSALSSNDINVTASVSNASQNATGSVTGLAIGSDTTNSRPPNWFFYILGAVVLGGAVALVIMKTGMPRFSISRSVNDKVAASVKKAPELVRAEKKIEDLQHQVVLLKNEEKIKELERIIANNKEEVERLRRGNT